MDSLPVEPKSSIAAKDEALPVGIMANPKIWNDGTRESSNSAVLPKVWGIQSFQKGPFPFASRLLPLELSLLCKLLLPFLSGPLDTSYPGICR